MRTLIVSEFVTLDGVMEAPGGEPTHRHTGWVVPYFGPEAQESKFHETRDSESLLLGRVTFESFHEGWSGGEGEFADKMNSMPKDVVTSTTAALGWNATVLTGDVVAGVTALKQGDGGPILVAGSCTLVHALVTNRLVDELRLMVFPVILGSGSRWYPESEDRFDFVPTSSQSFPKGVVVNSYVPA